MLHANSQTKSRANHKATQSSQRLDVKPNSEIVYAIQEIAFDYDHFVHLSKIAPNVCYMYVKEVQKENTTDAETISAKLGYFETESRNASLVFHLDFKQVLSVLPLKNRTIQEWYLNLFPRHKSELNLKNPESAFTHEGNEYNLDIFINGSETSLDFKITPISSANKTELHAAMNYVADLLSTANQDYIRTRAEESGLFL